jgi:uncharacterized membrane protein
MVAFKKRSWHWYIATKYGGLDSHTIDTNVCSYASKVLQGLAELLLIALIFGFCMGVPVVFMMGWVASMLIQWKFIEPNVLAMMGLGWIIFFLGIVVVIFTHRARVKLHQKLWKRQRDRYHLDSLDLARPIEPSLLATWYKSIKDKTCVNISFK